LLLFNLEIEYILKFVINNLKTIDSVYKTSVYAEREREFFYKRYFFYDLCFLCNVTTIFAEESNISEEKTLVNFLFAYFLSFELNIFYFFTDK
jgi:hypothetical protein